MELKRYVLLTNNEIRDLGSKKDTYGYAFNRYTSEHENMYYDHFEELKGSLVLTCGSGESKAINEIGTIKRTSDNILDLIELGDLIEIRTVPKTIALVEAIKPNNTGDTFIHFNYNDFVWLGALKVFYKRQPNGDYKRYEVEAWKTTI